MHSSLVCFCNYRPFIYIYIYPSSTKYLDQILSAMTLMGQEVSASPNDGMARKCGRSTYPSRNIVDKYSNIRKVFHNFFLRKSKHLSTSPQIVSRNILLFYILFTTYYVHKYQNAPNLLFTNIKTLIICPVVNIKMPVLCSTNLWLL